MQVFLQDFAHEQLAPIFSFGFSNDPSSLRTAPPFPLSELHRSTLVLVHQPSAEAVMGRNPKDLWTDASYWRISRDSSSADTPTRKSTRVNPQPQRLILACAVIVISRDLL